MISAWRWMLDNDCGCLGMNISWAILFLFSLTAVSVLMAVAALVVDWLSARKARAADLKEAGEDGGK